MHLAGQPNASNPRHRVGCFGRDGIKRGFGGAPPGGRVLFGKAGMRALDAERFARRGEDLLGRVDQHHFH